MNQQAAKYPLPQRWQILQTQFFEDSDWFTAYNRGKVFIISGKQGKHSINLGNAKIFSSESSGMRELIKASVHIKEKKTQS